VRAEFVRCELLAFASNNQFKNNILQAEVAATKFLYTGQRQRYVMRIGIAEDAFDRAKSRVVANREKLRVMQIGNGL
jgi:hypothetical protein